MAHTRYTRTGCANYGCDGGGDMVADPEGDYVKYADYAELLKALKWTLEYIDAIPKDAILPTMPGFDRDYVDDLVAQAGALAEPPEKGETANG